MDIFLVSSFLHWGWNLDFQILGKGLHSLDKSTILCISGSKVIKEKQKNPSWNHTPCSPRISRTFHIIIQALWENSGGRQMVVCMVQSHVQQLVIPMSLCLYSLGHSPSSLLGFIFFICINELILKYFSDIYWLHSLGLNNLRETLSLIEKTDLWGKIADIGTDMISDKKSHKNQT